MLTRWTIRLAVACYLARALLDLSSARDGGRAGSARNARRLWTAGCVLYLLHVLCAFGFYHEWSHDLAYQHTAQQTAALTGLHWGGGLYFNYAFTAIWLADLAAWWSRGVRFPYRSAVYFWTLHCVFAFMVFNATVIFGPPLWRWIAPFIFLAALAAYFALRRQSTA